MYTESIARVTQYPNRVLRSELLIHSVQLLFWKSCCGCGARGKWLWFGGPTLYHGAGEWGRPAAPPVPLWVAAPTEHITKDAPRWCVSAHNNQREVRAFRPRSNVGGFSVNALQSISAKESTVWKACKLILSQSELYWRFLQVPQKPATFLPSNSELMCRRIII